MLPVYKKNQTPNAIDKLLDNYVDASPDIINEEKKILVDLHENEKEFIIMAPVPGVPLDKIEVILEQDIITINAEPTVNNNKDAVYKECQWVKMSRSIRLPKNISNSGHSAKLESGILTITIKKIKPEPPKKITIKEYD